MGKVLVVLAVGLMLVGCAPATLNGVRAMGPQRLYQFQAPQNYQAVYRVILGKVRECFEAGMITAQQVVHGDLYTDIESGTISVELHGGLGTDIYQVIDIKAISPDMTDIKAYYSLGSVQKLGTTLKKWVLAGYKECN
ncbi:hypothetical protein KVP10_08590 [Candidimonas humi]|uniref:Uncharacterized protein n=1 Tax=Candidimonas humi TaxID=683355 RepID=A0ABV8NXP6_9BURK|nr:hypothetical protein [Candidimonas humi]MBV6304944.1 hypothetical protein [Candidimonas humi]